MQARRFHSIIRHHVLSSQPSTISRHAQLVVAHHHKHHLTITPATHRFIHTFHQRSLWNQQQQQQQQQQTTTTHDESVTTTSDSIQNNNNNGNAFIITTKEQQRANPNGILHEDFRFMIPMEDQLNAIRSGERVGPYDKQYVCVFACNMLLSAYQNQTTCCCCCDSKNLTNIMIPFLTISFLCVFLLLVRA